MDAVNVISLVVGVTGLILAIVQQIRIGSAKKKDFLRYWALAKDAHVVMAHVEGTKSAIDKSETCPPHVATSCGKAYGSAILLVRKAMENVFLQGIRFTDEQIEHWKNSGLLSGYLLHVFKQLRLEPPKERRGLSKTTEEEGSAEG